MFRWQYTSGTNVPTSAHLPRYRKAGGGAAVSGEVARGSLQVSHRVRFGREERGPAIEDIVVELHPIIEHFLVEGAEL